MGRTEHCIRSPHGPPHQQPGLGEVVERRQQAAHRGRVTEFNPPVAQLARVAARYQVGAAWVETLRQIGQDGRILRMENIGSGFTNQTAGRNDVPW